MIPVARLRARSSFLERDGGILFLVFRRRFGGDIRPRSRGCIGVLAHRVDVGLIDVDLIDVGLVDVGLINVGLIDDVDALGRRRFALEGSHLSVLSKYARQPNTSITSLAKPRSTRPINVTMNARKTSTTAV
jgi:hypothetical protein